MTELMREIIQLLVSGLTEYATGFFGALSTAVTSIFMTAEGGLSTFGGVLIIFAGISLAVGLSSLVFNWVSNLGK